MNYKISDLQASNLKIISVHPDSTLNEATSKMALHDFSQLPVMSNSRKIHGFISWKTISIQNCFGSKKKLVKEYMDKNVTVLNDSDNLLDSVNHILEKEFVFVKDVTGNIIGIITLYDIGFKFKQLSEPFIQIELIENSIRNIIDLHIPRDVFTTFCNNKFPDRKIKSSKDLTFGEYIGIIENKILWENFKINLDRKVFLEKLETIRLIRNDIMHFRIKDLSEDNLKNLKDVSKFFRILEKII